MKISVSSLCFNRLQKIDLKYLKILGVKAIELVIYHQFETYQISKKMVTFKSNLKKYDLEVSGIQGFTFKPNTDLRKEFYKFSNEWIDHLHNIVSCAILFETDKLIFGAPSFRVNINDKEQFVNSLIKSVAYLKLEGINLLLEAVPKKYGAVFFNTIDSVLDFNIDNGLSNHFDTGCFLNESPKSLQYSPIIDVQINHLHISSPDLGAISENKKLLNWIEKFGLPKVDDDFVVLESTLNLDNVFNAESDFKTLFNFLSH